MNTSTKNWTNLRKIKRVFNQKVKPKRLDSIDCGSEFYIKAICFADAIF